MSESVAEGTGSYRMTGGLSSSTTFRVGDNY